MIGLLITDIEEMELRDLLKEELHRIRKKEQQAKAEGKVGKSIEEKRRIIEELYQRMATKEEVRRYKSKKF
ncbi:hypothetical protein [Geomicrobium sp. JCM 19055]|uniref:hypothetical protein n=1 Tax=Geomicrobium sp. JCM 19055 TaxID=1460649 RepID=UPI00045ED8F8|nr:hypothetical protein [Geomicrobium sp. JCM 19055]GAK01109.1 hypothetical protein JCM19055_4251 [Geomicrobium sp. JCM 19055]